MCRTHHNTAINAYINRFDFETFLKIIQDHKITYAHIVPPVIIGLLKVKAQCQQCYAHIDYQQHPLTAKYDLTSLRHILSGAAPLAADVEMAVEKKFKSVDISLLLKHLI